MRVVLLTGRGVEHRYVTHRFIEDLGDELSAIIVAEGLPRSLGQRIKSYRRRYSTGQIISRVGARIHRKLNRLDEQRDRTYERVMAPPQIEPDRYTVVPTHNGDECLQLLDEIQPDVIAVYGTGIIRDPVCQRARAGILNMHTGLSPRYRGADTIFWPLHNEEPEWVGVTVHVLTQGIDAGPILATGQPEIAADDDEDSLFAKTVIVGTELFLEQVRATADGTAEGTIQDHSEGLEYRFVHRTAAAEKRVAKLVREGLLRRYVAERE